MGDETQSNQTKKKQFNLLKEFDKNFKMFLKVSITLTIISSIVFNFKNGK